MDTIKEVIQVILFDLKLLHLIGKISTSFLQKTNLFHNHFIFASREDEDNENGIADITSPVYRVKPSIEKYQNTAELSKERELLELKKIIKNQQLELIRLQQAAAESEQRAKVRIFKYLSYLIY